MSDSNSGEERNALSPRISKELDYLDIALEDAKLLAERRKVLAKYEDEREAREKQWREVGRPLEIRQEYWRRAYLSAIEGLVFRGESLESARAQAEEHANIIAGAENKP